MVRQHTLELYEKFQADRSHEVSRYIPDAQQAKMQKCRPQGNPSQAVPGYVLGSGFNLRQGPQGLSLTCDSLLSSRAAAADACAVHNAPYDQVKYAVSNNAISCHAISATKNSGLKS